MPIQAPKFVQESSQPYGLMFHHIGQGPEEKKKGAISKAAFEEILLTVGIENILSADNWMANVEGCASPESKVCLTFDDALRCQVDFALPVLEKFDLKAFWFVQSGVFQNSLSKFEIYGQFVRTVYSSFDKFFSEFLVFLEEDFGKVSVDRFLEKRPVDYLKNYPFYSEGEITYRFLRDQVLGEQLYSEVMENLLRRHHASHEDLASMLWMTSDHLRHLNQTGHIIGLHSYTHPTNLAELTEEEQKSEYERNFDHLEQVIGGRPIAMAHPVNSYNDVTLGILSELGIRVGFRSNTVMKKGGNLEFPREDAANFVVEN